jgi:hypothetical protein
MQILRQLPFADEAWVVNVNQQEIPLLQAHLWIHRNRPSSRDLLPRPFKMEIPEGISVFPQGAQSSPRLPLLGLRGLMRNNLRLVVADFTVSLSD